MFMWVSMTKKMTPSPEHTCRDEAVRYIQDQEFVQPGDRITLDFYQAVQTYQAGYAAGRKSAMPSESEVDAKIKEWGLPTSKSEWIGGTARIGNLLGYEVADYIRDTVEWLASRIEGEK